MNDRKSLGAADWTAFLTTYTPLADAAALLQVGTMRLGVLSMVSACFVVGCLRGGQRAVRGRHKTHIEHSGNQTMFLVH